MQGETETSADKPSYFLISVSTRENLELCIRYGLAGFPSGGSGAWTFCETRIGDFVSFLYGARAHNLYRIVGREAIRNAQHLPPWKPLTFSESGRTYSFPFRLRLQAIRTFVEPLVRAEFSYVAENLLLRGGYRKTHFQADQTTLQSVSQLGTVSSETTETLSAPTYETFDPSFTRNAALLSPPEVFRFQELILQSAIRHHLGHDRKLAHFLRDLNLNLARPESLEILGEKALTQGHIDLLLKQRVPLGSSQKIPIEVKTNRGKPKDVVQLRGYMDEIGECIGGVLIADDFSKDTFRTAEALGIFLARYTLSSDLRKAQTFEALCQGIDLQPVRS